MHRLFAQLASSSIKPMNPEVMNGLACTYIAKSMEYIDAVMKSVASSFPAGLEYLGCQRCTAQEEHEEACKPKNNKRYFDIARSDTYMVKFLFRYEGKDLPPRYISLPFVSDGGILHLGGPAYHITPVLADKVISPGFNTVFVKLQKAKIIFKRIYHPVFINNTAESQQIIWSRIYNNQTTNKSVPKTTDALTCMGHYLFAKYGVTGTFMKYCGFIPEFGNEEINAETYPPDVWQVYESRGIKPKTYKQREYTPSTLRIAIRKDQLTPLSNQLACEFFYIVDHFPDEIRKEYIDNKDMWMVLLGHIIFSGNFTVGKLHLQISEHFQSINGYIDIFAIQKLREKGFYIEDFFDLIALILQEFNSFLHHLSVDSNNVYNKNFDVLYYTLFDITSGIVTANYKLNKIVSKGRRLTEKEISETFSKEMSTGRIFLLVRGKVVLNSLSYSGDHKYPKITSSLAEQENLADATRGKKTHRTIGREHRIHTSTIEVGSVLFLPKKNPTPVSKINPYIQIDLDTGSIVRKEHLRKLLDTTQAMLAGVSSTTNCAFNFESDVENISREES